MKGIIALCALLASSCASAQTLTVGSKRFTESYVLGEIVSQTANGTHKPGLGNTAILLEALKAGAIDVYPEYTGTIAREILRSEDRLDLAALNAKLKPLGLAASIPLGFSNSYALGMRRKDAERLGIRKVSDLAKHPAQRFGLSHEFLGRRDGWPGLQAAYGLPQKPRGLDHGIAYEALAAGEIDVMDLYTTDAKIERYAIVALEDDRRFFPPYDAVLLYRADTPTRFPKEMQLLKVLEGRIDAATMVKLNARAEIDKVSFSDVAGEYLGSRVQARKGLWAALFAPDFGRLLAEHLGLVFGSLAIAALIGIPLGMLAARVPWLAQPVLVTAGLLQTIPALALLALLIPVTGTIGVWPALIALFLYALLPITRNTHTGVTEVRRGLVDAGTALGLTRLRVLVHVEMPLALPVIMAGVKTAAVISVGTATIAAFIGAGGFGERITQGLALNDHIMLLAGALPAAALALAVHAVFELAERAPAVSYHSAPWPKS
jgi:osmoprotectant transport system permease protein